MKAVHSAMVNKMSSHKAILPKPSLIGLDDESKVHPTHLEQSLAEFNLLLGIYYSGITNEVIDLPFDPPDGLMDQLRAKL